MEKQSLNLEGLNLEKGELKRLHDRKKRDKNIFFQENLTSTTGKDVEQQQTALRRTTLLKQRIISTELKLDSLKKQEIVHKPPVCELCYETQLDELNIKLDNYIDALDKETEKNLLNPLKDSFNNGFTVSSITKRRSVAIGEKLNCQNYPCDMEESIKSKKNPLRVIGHFLDTKIRGHKRIKSDEFKVLDCNQPFRSRTLTNPLHVNRIENFILSKNMEKLEIEPPLQPRSEIDPSAIAEIEAFEKFIKDYFDHPRNYSF